MNLGPLFYGAMYTVTVLLFNERALFMAGAAMIRITGSWFG